MANDEKLSFYVFDNLRCSQDGEGSNVHRFEALDDAIAFYEGLPKEWTSALGGSRGDLSELDLVQRRQGSSTLITDFNNFPEWRGDSEVQQAIGALTDRLGIDVMADRSIIEGPILVPIEEQDPADDRYLADKELRLREPGSPASAINEAYLSGEGWVSPQRLSELSRDFGYSNPRCPLVSQLNVAYEAEDGRTGQMDITPREYGFLVEKTLGRELAPSERGSLFERGTVSSLMGQISQWREAAAYAIEHGEAIEQLARKAKERASERNAGRSGGPPNRTRSHDSER